MTNSKYNVNTYSPEGRIYQIEYAMKASNLGTAILGIVTDESTVLISEKKQINPLQKIDSVKKHWKVFDHIALGYSGISGDARSIVNISQNFCLYHMKMYNENISAESLLRYLCSLSLKFSEKDASRKIFGRPFGSSILLAAYEDEPKLYMLDPSGSYRRFKAKALGSAAKSLESELEKAINDMNTQKNAIHNGLSMLGEIMQEPLTENNVEIMAVGKDGVKIFTKEEIRDALKK